MQLGQEIAARGMRLIYGGGCVGLMGVLADATLAAGAEVIGVIPKALLEREVGHLGLTQLSVVESMHQRKAQMAELADAFLALPGGFGTLEEFCEVLTWVQLGIHNKPCGLLSTRGFYDPLLAMFDRAVADHLLKPAIRNLVLVESEVSRMLDRLAAAKPSSTREFWFEKDQT